MNKKVYTIYFQYYWVKVYWLKIMINWLFINEFRQFGILILCDFYLPVVNILLADL